MAHWLAFASFAIRSALAFRANFATCAYERADICFTTSADPTCDAAPASDEPPESTVSEAEELDPWAA